MFGAVGRKIASIVMKQQQEEEEAGAGEASREFEGWTKKEVEEYAGLRASTLNQ